MIMKSLTHTHCHNLISGSISVQLASLTSLFIHYVRSVCVLISSYSISKISGSSGMSEVGQPGSGGR